MPSFCIFCGGPFFPCPRRDTQGNESSLDGDDRLATGHYLVEAIPKEGEFDDMKVNIMASL